MVVAPRLATPARLLDAVDLGLPGRGPGAVAGGGVEGEAVDGPFGRGGALGGALDGHGVEVEFEGLGPGYIDILARRGGSGFIFIFIFLRGGVRADFFFGADGGVRAERAIYSEG